MENEDYIRAGEFTRAISSLERQMAAGFDRNSREIANVSRGLHKRLDLVDDKTSEHGEEIAVLKAKATEIDGIDSRVTAVEKGNRNSAGTWGGSIAAVVMIGAEALKAAFGWGK